MNTVTLHFKADGQQLIALDSVYSYASNTVDYIIADFQLGDNWTGFDVVTAVWYTDFDCISTVLDGDGVCVVPHEVLTKRGQVQVNLVGADLDEEESYGAELIDRLTTYPLKAILIDANARICGTETAPVTPSQFEQFIAIVKAEVGKVRDIESTVLNPDYTLTINYSDGTSDTVGPIRGEKGETGATGATGNGISKIEKIGTAGLVDTYRITYTNGAHYDYTVTNGAKGETGNGIESIYLTGTSGAVKTYTILFTNGDTFEYQVTDGEVTFAALDTMLEPLLIKDTASGSIASFPDGQNVYPLRKCTVQIEPIQDLHGYDSPWVAGGGKNLWNDKWTNYTKPADYRICPITLEQDAKYTVSVSLVGSAVTGCVVGIVKDGDRYNNFVQPSPWAFIQTSGAVNYSQWTFTIDSSWTSPKLVIFCADETTFNSVFSNYHIQIEKGDSVSTWTPFSNICPISGRSSVGVTDCGKNLFDKSTVVFGERFNAGGTTSVTNTLARSALIRIKPSTAYYFTNVVSAQTYSCVWWYDKDGNNVGYNSIAGGIGEAVSGTFTSPATAYYAGVNLYGTHIDDAMVHEGSSASAYEQYNGTTTTIPLGTTVYGGSDEVVSGVGSSTLESVSLDGTNLASYLSVSQDTTADGSKYVAFINDSSFGKEDGKAYSDQYKWIDKPLSYLHVGEFNTRGGYIRIVLADQTLDTLAKLKTYLANNPIQLVYTKKTADAFTTEPQTIQTLQGRNNIFSDAGEVEVTYVADTKLYIDKVTS